MTLTLDHVVYGVGDLTRAAGSLRERFGLASLPGGRHPGWGTANRIVPLGDTYLELLAVVDPEEAAQDAFGMAVGRMLAGGDRPLLWVLGSDDLDGVAARLGLPIRAKSRVLPDGRRVSWRSAGLEAACATPWLPFFIDWQIPPALHPGRMACRHDVDPAGIDWVQVGADPLELAEWLGGESVAVRLGGPPGVNAVAIATAGGELVIR